MPIQIGDEGGADDRRQAGTAPIPYRRTASTGEPEGWSEWRTRGTRSTARRGRRVPRPSGGRRVSPASARCASARGPSPRLQCKRSSGSARWTTPPSARRNGPPSASSRCPRPPWPSRTPPGARHGLRHSAHPPTTSPISTSWKRRLQSPPITSTRRFPRTKTWRRLTLASTTSRKSSPVMPQDTAPSRPPKRRRAGGSPRRCAAPAGALRHRGSGGPEGGAAPLDVAAAWRARRGPVASRHGPRLHGSRASALTSAMCASTTRRRTAPPRGGSARAPSPGSATSGSARTKAVADRRLMAHELTHVMQQTASGRQRAAVRAAGEPEVRRASDSREGGKLCPRHSRLHADLGDPRREPHHRRPRPVYGGEPDRRLPRSPPRRQPPVRRAQGNRRPPKGLRLGLGQAYELNITWTRISGLIDQVIAIFPTWPPVVEIERCSSRWSTTSSPSSPRSRTRSWRLSSAAPSRSPGLMPRRCGK